MEVESKILKTDFVEIFAEHIITALAANVWPLAPEYFERLVCEGLGITYKRTNRGLVDCNHPEVGYSVKSLKFKFTKHGFTISRGKNKGKRKKLHIYLARTSDDYNGKQIIANQTLAALAGELILDIWDVVLEAGLIQFPTLRTVIILYSADYLKWCICEVIPQSYKANEFFWKWANKVNLWGVKGDTVLKWQAHGRQFGVKEPITQNNIMFELVKPPNIRDKILTEINYDKNTWIKVHGAI